MSAKQKICFIAATLGNGGAEKQAYYLIKTLTKNDHQLKVIYFEPEDWWLQPINELGVEVVRIIDTSKKNRITKAYRLLKKEGFDIVQALHYHMNPYAAMLGLMLGAKSVGAFRGDGERELLTVNKYVRSITFHFVKAFVCNSRSTIDKLSGIDSLKGKLNYLPNIVEVPGAVQSNKSELPTKFLAVNSLVALKRIDRILKFISTYQKHNAAVELKVLGDGPLRPELEAAAKNLGIENRVSFEGRVDNVADYYHGADVFMLASESEGTPNVILEAMSHGKVIISSRVGEAGHLLGDGKYGVLIDFDNNNDLENICVRLSTDWGALKSMGERAFHQIEEHHSFAHLYSNVRSIYQRL
ncbi:MAG: glycosyltransferase family 4 protein [Roseivirga sp.]